MNPNRQTQFPPAWLWLTDEAIPMWVKRNYSPRDSWKEKPFSQEDSRFFFKGIEELSELFTDERPKAIPAYFHHPRFRSAYLLYFFPLQAAKFLTVFQLYPKAIEAALLHAKKTGVLRIVDLGAGPGTASLSLLLFLLNYKLSPGESLPPIELDWFDTNAEIMADGRALVEQLSANFPKLRNKVTIRTHKAPWWKSPPLLPDEISLTLMGHLLNESNAPQNEVGLFWKSILARSQGGGTLIIEPAAKKSSQLLSRIRDGLFEAEFLEASPTRIWGPCLHAGRCPLSEGRDWCHFSAPAHIPGKWFKNFSNSLSSERHWVKLTYLWIASSQFPAEEPESKMRRVISDSLTPTANATLLLCEPEVPRRWSVPPGPRSEPVGRGDIVKVSTDR